MPVAAKKHEMVTFRSRYGAYMVLLYAGGEIWRGNTRVGTDPAKFAVFKDFELKTDDEKVIEKLRSLPEFGVDVWEEKAKAEPKPEAPTE